MEEYFENIARELIAINHNPGADRKRFYAIYNTSQLFQFGENNDFLNDIRRHPLEPVMVYVIDNTGQMLGGNKDSKLRRKFGHVFILQKFQKNDFSGIKDWMTTAEQIINQIIARMDRDIRRDENDIPLDTNIIGGQFNDIHNSTDNFHGTGFSFSYDNRFCEVYDESQWQEIS